MKKIYLLLGHQPLIILELDIKIHKVLFQIHFINSEYKTKWENRQHRLRIEIIEYESDDGHQEDFDSTFLPQKRVRKYTNRPKSDINPSDDPETEADQHSESLEFILKKIILQVNLKMMIFL